MTNSGKKWYNNGFINKMFSEEDIIPEDFKPGKIQKHSESGNKGKKVYSDGNSIILLGVGDPIPEGFRRGTSDKQREHLKSISSNSKGITRSEEQRKIISDKAKLRLADKNNHPLYGKHHSQKTREKISAATIGRKATNKGIQLTPEQKILRDRKIVENYGSLEAFYLNKHSKALQTKQERYGNPNYNNSEKAALTRAQDPDFYKKAQEKTRNTIITRYGSFEAFKSKISEKVASNAGFDSVEAYFKFWRANLYKHKLTESKLEKRFEEFLINNNFIYEKHYLLSNSEYAHEFDFAVFYNNKLNILVDCDGLYYHGYLSDNTGKRVNNYSDDYRTLLIPEGVKFQIIVEGRDSERQGFIDFLHNFDIDYQAYIDEIFRWCREISFPYPHYSDKILENSYKSLIKSDPNVLNFKARFGEKIILNFHPSIYRCHKKNKRSPYEAWQDDKLLQKCIENRLIYKGNKLDESRVLNGLSVTGIAPKVSIFNPYIAKYLCNKYLQDFSTIFDPCAGYSGRMLGVCSLDKHYIGYDINSTTIVESTEVLKHFNLNAELYIKDSLKDTGSYDCLFTCTPYADKESWGVAAPCYNCDEWIDLLISRYKCKRYLFVVDKTEKYKDYIVETLINKSHFGNNTEYVIKIDQNQLSLELEDEE